LELNSKNSEKNEKILYKEKTEEKLQKSEDKWRISTKTGLAFYFNHCIIKL